MKSIAGPMEEEEMNPFIAPSRVLTKVTSRRKRLLLAASLLCLLAISAAWLLEIDVLLKRIVFDRPYSNGYLHDLFYTPTRSATEDEIKSIQLQQLYLLLDNSSSDGTYAPVVSSTSRDRSFLRQGGFENSTKIPNTLHFVHFIVDLENDLPYWIYLNIMKAITVQRPDNVMLHTHIYWPSGENVTRGDVFQGKPTWEKVLRYVSVRYVRDVAMIYGNPVNQLAHKSDVIRLEALRRYGGIYLDTDMVLLQSLQPLMEHSTKGEVIMGKELEFGLCNAVIISPPRSNFLVRWYTEYKTFDDNNWAGHSVYKPKTLAKSFPSEIIIVPQKYFFEPYYNVIAHKAFGNDSIQTLEGQFAMHLWHSQVKHLLAEVKGPEYFCKNLSSETNSTYKTVMLPLLHSLGEC